MSNADLAAFELVSRLRQRDDLDSKDAADLIVWLLDAQASMRDAYRQATTYPDNPDIFVIRKDPDAELGVVYTPPSMVGSIVVMHDTGARARA